MRRSYHQFCGVARALDVIGERWTLLVVRDLLLGPRRYSDLMTELPGITTNLLAKRLAELEAASLVVRETRSGSPAVTVYALTAAGCALEPIVMELGRWGGRYMDRPKPDDRVDLGWALLSATRRYRGGVRAVVELRVEGDGDRRFELAFGDERMRVTERGIGGSDAGDREASPPAAIVHGRAEDLRIAFASPDAAMTQRAVAALEVDGDVVQWRAAFAAVTPEVGHRRLRPHMRGRRRVPAFQPGE